MTTPRNTCSPARLLLVTLLVFIAAPSIAQAGDPGTAAGSYFVLEAFGGAGVSMFDKEMWTGQTETALNDWSHFARHYGVRALYYPTNSKTGFGIEISDIKFGEDIQILKSLQIESLLINQYCQSKT